ncbi:MAG: hypothetical protein CENE_02559 [Candidatus Celerinatantimonas neptuna]|nr:MAG: hypothetical protein CENE_02559 [Candidatus Celerinatantimonas neptuna]
MDGRLPGLLAHCNVLVNILFGLISGWMRYVGGIDEKGLLIDVVDPMASELRPICDECDHSSEVVSELLKIDAIFPDDLASNSLFVESVTAVYQKLMELRARCAVVEFIKNKS